MFRSAENLRLAADMRALQRVAAPWREARSTWFDGTPESIEGRLAATERVLTYARGGVTQAHIALEREASIARAELKEASHRLMVDFLDDGARAFKGSKRVAFGHNSEDGVYCEKCGNKEPEELGYCPKCGDATPEDGHDPMWADAPWEDPDDEQDPFDPRLLGASKRVAGPLCNSCGKRTKDGYCKKCDWLSDDGDDYWEDDTHTYDGKEWKKKGSKRVAGADEDYAREEREFWNRHVKDTGPGMGYDDDEYNDAMHREDERHYSRRRNADKDMSVSTDSGTAATPLSSMPTAPTVEMGGSASASIPGAIGKMLWNGSTMTGQEPPADHAADLAAAKMGYRSAAYDMVECSRCGKEIPDDGNQVVDTSTPGSYTHDKKGGTLEDFCPDCMPKKYKRRKSFDPPSVGGRNAAFLPDFDDSLLFGD